MPPCHRATTPPHHHATTTHRATAPPHLRTTTPTHHHTTSSTAVCPLVQVAQPAAHHGRTRHEVGVSVGQRRRGTTRRERRRQDPPRPACFRDVPGQRWRHPRWLRRVCKRCPGHRRRAGGDRPPLELACGPHGPPPPRRAHGHAAAGELTSVCACLLAAAAGTRIVTVWMIHLPTTGTLSCFCLSLWSLAVSCCHTPTNRQTVTKSFSFAVHVGVWSNPCVEPLLVCVVVAVHCS